MDIDFDDEFAAACDYARLYRQLGLQVVPAMSPGEAKEWKRPLLKDWRSLQNDLVDQATFDSWFGEQGLHVTRTNIGILTGRCSGNLFVVDLDEQKGPEAGMWWQEMLDRQEHAGEIEETVTQITGGGGRQVFFRAPEGWTPPTNKQPAYNVDIRGQGGFVVCAPSKHASGRNYAWVEGRAPHECEIAVAPRWLCNELDALFGMGGAVDPLTGATRASGAKVRTATPDEVLHPFGGLVDGREDKMARMVWARVLDLHRAAPIMPTDEELLAEARELFAEYVNAVHARHARPGATKEELLEEEGRGWSLMVEKFRSALKQWDGKVAREAAKLPPKPADEPERFREALVPPHEPAAAAPASAPILDPFIAASETTYEVLSLANLMQLPDPRWIIDDVMIENGLSFIFGPPGCGKSFIALGMAAAVAARRRDWWGRRIEHSGPVIYIASEGVADLKNRVSVWLQEMGVAIDDTALHVIRQGINFTSISDINKLATTVGDYERKMSEKPVMVIVDTVSRALPGVDENQQKDMTIFVKACDFLRETFGCAIIGVHHEGRATGQMRGSTVLPGAADQIYHVKREKGSMEGSFIAEKIKAAADSWEWTFLLRNVQLPTTTIKPRGSLFAERIMEEPLGAPGDGFGGDQETGCQIINGKKWPPKETCRDIVNAIGRAWSEGDPWSMSNQVRRLGRYAPELIAKSFPVSIEMAEHMVHQWLLEGVLSDNEVVNTKSKKRGLRVKMGLSL